MNTYDRLLIGKRAQESSITGRSIAEEAASDHSRVVYSPPFRRLQQKAQVFSLETNAAVRSRMTHTLEVADVGKLIARQIIDKLSEAFPTPGIREAFVTFVETGCLLHDIGNPPFGHFGEAAIQRWFSANWKQSFKKSCETIDNGALDDELADLEVKVCDFIEFDGNPQGLRVATLLQWNRDQYGLNLTYTQIVAALKYVRSTADKPGQGLCKKPGYFQTEKDIVAAARSAVGLTEGQRFPLTYIIEAADDIAYCISDIEDGVEKGILDSREFAIELAKEWSGRHRDQSSARFPFGLLSQEFVDDPCRANATKQFDFFLFKISFTRHLITQAVESYITNHHDVLEGRIDELLGKGSEARQLLDVLKTVARKLLFRSQEAEKIELAGYSVIHGLLENYRPLLDCSADRFGKLIAAMDDPSVLERSDQLDVEWRLFHKLPPKYVEAYKHSIKECEGKKPQMEWCQRAHLIVDYISGMTDQYALETYKELLGVSIG